MARKYGEKVILFEQSVRDRLSTLWVFAVAQVHGDHDNEYMGSSDYEKRIQFAEIRLGGREDTHDTEDNRPSPGEPVM
jgi:hypothetical protein